MNNNVIVPTKNPNGTTTYRIPAMFGWWTTDEVEANAMIDQYNRVGHYEQEK